MLQSCYVTISARRLTALLQDISTLNRMDYAARQLMKERTDISAIVSDIVEETSFALEFPEACDETDG